MEGKTMKKLIVILSFVALMGCATTNQKPVMYNSENRARVGEPVKAFNNLDVDDIILIGVNVFSLWP